MIDELSLLVVDVSEAWEEVLKANERSYFIDWDFLEGGYAKNNRLNPQELLEISYPYGNIRAGFNAITDTVRIASMRNKTIYAVYFYTGWTDGEEQPCYSLQPYIPEENIFEKHAYSAFRSEELADRLEKDKCKHLMVLGYDRDCCILETIKDAVARGIKVVTSEQIMLTKDEENKREQSLKYFKENTLLLETLEDVWNYIIKPLP